jgi:hypothetical protein
MFLSGLASIEKPTPQNAWRTAGPGCLGTLVSKLMNKW